MDTMMAFTLGAANRNREQKVFDWKKAAKIIKERNAQYASAGLAEDWGWTGGDILTNGKPVPKDDTYTYLASTWATPVLNIDGESIECYRMQSKTPKWNADTYWPDEAIKILNKKSRKSKEA